MQLRKIYRFRRALRHLPTEPRWPLGFSIARFEPLRHAPLVHRMLAEGYAAGGGQVTDLDSWWSGLSNDAEYDPSLIFLVCNQDAAPAAVAICWSSAYVKDLVVAAPMRRRGLAGNLLRHTFHLFRTRGADAVDLKVDSENRAAISLYRSLGMTCVETLHVAS